MSYRFLVQAHLRGHPEYDYFVLSPKSRWEDPHFDDEVTARTFGESVSSDYDRVMVVATNVHGALEGQPIYVRGAPSR